MYSDVYTRSKSSNIHTTVLLAVKGHKQICGSWVIHYCHVMMPLHMWYVSMYDVNLHKHENKEECFYTFYIQYFYLY